MTVLDVRRKRTGLLTDRVFMSLSSDQKTTPVQGGAYSGFTANAKTFWVDPEIYYRLLDKERFSVDAVGGGRLWRLDNSVNLQPGVLAAASVGKEFKRKYSVLLGYRYLYVDYKNGGFLFDTRMDGLLAGFAIHFK
jgi:hypothetical protein